MITRLNIGHIFTHLFDNSSTLVSEHCRQRGRIHLIPDDQIGVADTDTDYPHEDLVVARLIEFDLLDLERCALLFRHGCLYLHECVLFVIKAYNVGPVEKPVTLRDPPVV